MYTDFRFFRFGLSCVGCRCCQIGDTFLANWQSVLCCVTCEGVESREDFLTDTISSFDFLRGILLFKLISHEEYIF